MARKKNRDAKELTTLDEYLDEQGTRGTFEAHALLEVRARQIKKRSKAKVLPKSKKERKSAKVVLPS
jgi:hypothetical protein